MSDREALPVAGTDVGTECVKAVVVAADRRILGRAIVPTRGYYFQDCYREALGNALAEAKLQASGLGAAAVTGFGARCAPEGVLQVSEAACHAQGAFHHRRQAMTLVDIGGREPRVIHVDAAGTATGSRGVRRCALGIGTFLMFTARHLDVHPTRLMELAATAERPAPVGSYCSVFAEVETIELLRDGATAGEIALGAMYSIADRIMEIERLDGPLTVTGGVCEYFPAVIRALGERSGQTVEMVPEPIMSGALGAALIALDGARA